MWTLLSTVVADTNPGQWLFLGWFGFLLLLLVAGIIGSVFWLWMLVDAIKNPALDDIVERIVWVLVVVFLHFVGHALVYFLAARDKGTRRRV